MSAIEALRDKLPEAASDIRLNLQSVLDSSSLNDAQKWMVAVASALSSRNPELRAAVLADAEDKVSNEVIEDAKASAALMAMNNVFYRFRHFMEAKEIYKTLPARLRMNRIGRPLSNKVDFELACLAVSAINGCDMCVRSHEEVVVKGGLSEQNVVDAVRIAATMHAAAQALELT
ncbi:MAG: carboxymuconolactone decarboxylase family protein [Clostridia bacterium]|nr:carboxymuconolactone decarboxylase family protein [Deltaproteobacteria bacterium]